MRPDLHTFGLIEGFTRSQRSSCRSLKDTTLWSVILTTAGADCKNKTGITLIPH